MGHLYRRLIAFDLDGTLVDSRQDLADSANELISELGGQPLPTEAVAAMVGNGAAMLVRDALASAGVVDGGTALPRFLAIYDQRLLSHTRLYPGIDAVLAVARSCATLAVLTNKPLAPSEVILEGLGVRHLVDHVIGGDGLHPRKPDPGGLLALMTLSDAAPRSTLLVGDSEVDRETATRADAHCCLVTYGFGNLKAAASPRASVVDDAAGLVAAIRRFAATPRD